MNAITQISVRTGLILEGDFPRQVDEVKDFDDDLGAIAVLMDDEADNDLDAYIFPRWSVALHDETGARDITADCIKALVKWRRARNRPFECLDVPPWWAEHDPSLSSNDFHEDPRPDGAEALTVHSNGTITRTYLDA